MKVLASFFKKKRFLFFFEKRTKNLHELSSRGSGARQWETPDTIERGTLPGPASSAILGGGTRRAA
jgi:hypothetical protein